MIRQIRIRNYKGFRDTGLIHLSPFHVLVGPNGSGKTTFLEAIDFVRSCLLLGPSKAIENLAPEYRDLTFERKGGPIHIELFLDPPENAGSGMLLRYLLEVRDDRSLGVAVAEEELKRVRILSRKAVPLSSSELRLLGKTRTGGDFYRRENSTYTDSFVFGRDKLSLQLVPPDERRYPTGNAIKRFLSEGVRYLQLNSRAMRQPCPATRPTELELDGSNIARVVGRILNERRKNGDDRSHDLVRDWVDHLALALEGLQSISWNRRPPDNAEYILVEFAKDRSYPSWLLSDGTLRMLALTLPAFLPVGSSSLYLVEEPENGVHPKALEIIIGALQAVSQAQVFVATHSPMVVQLVGAEPLLCFGRGDRGMTITPGQRHPALRDWDGSPELGVIFAERLLG